MAHKSPQPSKIRCNSVCGFTRTERRSRRPLCYPSSPSSSGLSRGQPRQVVQLRITQSTCEWPARTHSTSRTLPDKDTERKNRRATHRTSTGSAYRRGTKRHRRRGSNGSTTTFGKGDGCVTACDVTRASLCVRVPRVVECGA